MKIDEAFREMIDIRGIDRVLGVDSVTVRGYRFRMKGGGGLLSYEKKRDLLIKAGYRLLKEEDWTGGDIIKKRQI